MKCRERLLLLCALCLGIASGCGPGPIRTALEFFDAPEPKASPAAEPADALPDPSAADDAEAYANLDVEGDADAVEEPGEDSCKIPYTGPVTVIPVPNRHALEHAARSLEGRAPLAYRTEDTAVFEDGRVVTSNTEDVGNHLNDLGWASNPLKIVGASIRANDSAAQYAWRSNQATGGMPAPKKRRRRRG